MDGASEVAAVRQSLAEDAWQTWPEGAAQRRY